MQNINRWRSDQFQPTLYLESGQFDTRGLRLHGTNVVICLISQLTSLSHHCFLTETAMSIVDNQMVFVL